MIKILSSLTKREKLIFSVIVLSLGLFIAEHLLGKSGIFTVFTIAILTDLLLFLSLKSDLKENTFLQIFILPFFFLLQQVQLDRYYNYQNYTDRNEYVGSCPG